MASPSPTLPRARMRLAGATTAGNAETSYGRLELVAWILAGLATVPLLAWPLEDWLSGGRGQGDLWNYTRVVALILVSIGVALGCRKNGFAPNRFAGIALTYEILTAVALGAGVVGWQWTIGTDTLTRTWATTGGTQPWNLGGTLAWTGVWIIIFATLVPMDPRRHLYGGLAATASVVVWTFLSPVMQGFPQELLSVKTGLTIRLASVIGVPMLIATAMAYAAARYVYGLSREVSKARRLGSYVLHRKLGEGGMGEVWLGNHSMLARTAAIKLIKADNAGTSLTDTIVKRFQQEVHATAQLRSPHTIEVYDYGVAEDGTFYYVMEYLDGLDLAALVQTHGPLPWQRVVYIVQQMCHSLGEAHHLGMVHRDIKPANIFLCRIGRDVDQVKVLDFGLVKDVEVAPDEAELTVAGTFVGTPAYASPEMAKGGAEGLDARSDIYSIGCVAWYLLTGRLVFHAQTPLELLMKHVGEQAKPPSTSAEHDLPGELDNIVLACLEKDPNDRISSADELATRLRALAKTDEWGPEDAIEWWQRFAPLETFSAESRAGATRNEIDATQSGSSPISHDNQ